MLHAPTCSNYAGAANSLRITGSMEARHTLQRARVPPQANVTAVHCYEFRGQWVFALSPARPRYL